MDPVGITRPVITPKQSAPMPSLPSPASAAPASAVIGQGGGDFDAQTAELKRAEAVRKAAQDIADVFIVGDSTFAIFKDTTGQYVTRFTSLRDGRVTYIPEPQLFKMANSSSAPVLTIQA